MEDGNYCSLKKIISIFIDNVKDILQLFIHQNFKPPSSISQLFLFIIRNEIFPCQFFSYTAQTFRCNSKIGSNHPLWNSQK